MTCISACVGMKECIFYGNVFQENKWFSTFLTYFLVLGKLVKNITLKTFVYNLDKYQGR